MYVIFISPNKYAILYTNIEGAYPTHIGTSVPSSGRTKCQF